MKTYLVPIVDAQGRQTLLRVRATSLSDARIRATALIPSGSTLGAGPTEVIDADGNVVQSGIGSIQQNFPTFNVLANLESINSISQFPAGGLSELFGGEDPGGTFGGFQDPGVDFGGPTGDLTGASEFGGLEGISGGEFPFAAFTRGVRAQGLDPLRGAFSNLISGQAAPLGQAFRIRQLTGAEPAGRTFQEFVTGTPLSQTPQLSLNAFQRVFGGGAVPETLAGLRAGGTEQARRQASQLGRSAAGARFSPFTATFLPGAAEVENRFQAAPVGPDLFSSFIRRQFGLG